MLFDAQTFLTQTLGDAPLDTRSIPLPPGQRIPFQVLEIKLNTGESDDKKNPGQKRRWFQYEAVCETTDPEHLSKWDLKQDSGADMEKATLRYQFFLDTTESGNIALGPGKNVRLGAFMEACGVNRKGASLTAPTGQMVRFDIIHKVGNTGNPFADIINPTPY